MHAGNLLPVLVLSASVAAAEPPRGAPQERSRSPQPLQHQHETGQPPQKLGEVSFETSCDPKLAS